MLNFKFRCNRFNIKSQKYNMYTQQIKRRKSNAFFEMKTINAPSQKDKVIEKLGSSIYASMDRLQSLKASIMSSSVKDLKPLILDFQREHASFIDKQKSLMEIQQSSDKIIRLKAKVKEFLEVFTPDQIERRLQSIKEDRMRESHQETTPQQQQQVQINKYEGQSFRRRLLDEEEEQLKQIERLMAVIKQIAIDTSQLVIGIGAKLNIAAESMKAARLRMKQARAELVETNQYEQDTAKVKIFLCALITVILIVLLLLFRAASSK